MESPFQRLLIILLLIMGAEESASSKLEIDFYLNPNYPPPEMGMFETSTNLLSLYDLTTYTLKEGIEPLKLEGVPWKLSTLLLWDISNVNYLITVVHELGHGQRSLESGQGAAYEIPYNYLPLTPWLGCKKATTYTVLKLGASDSENIQRFVVGGLEAENVLVKVIRKRLYVSTPISGLIFLESIFSENGTLSYILRTTPGDGGDVSNWLDEMIKLETGDTIASLEDLKKLHRDIRQEVLIFSLLNPPLWQSIFFMLTLPFSHSPLTKVPMFRLGRLEFMPALSYGLTSLGTENYFEFYWRSGLISGKWYLGYQWRIAESDAVSTGFNLSNIPFRSHLLNFNFHGWTGKHWGGAFEPEIGIVTKKSVLSISAGVKSEGYLQGLPYEASSWLRLGLKIKLDE